MILYSLLHGICMAQMKGPCDTLFVVTWHLYGTGERPMDTLFVVTWHLYGTDEGPRILYSLLHDICMAQMKGPWIFLFVLTWHLYDTDERAM